MSEANDIAEDAARSLDEPSVTCLFCKRLYAGDDGDGEYFVCSDCAEEIDDEYEPRVLDDVEEWQEWNDFDPDC